MDEAKDVASHSTRLLREAISAEQSQRGRSGTGSVQGSLFSDAGLGGTRNQATPDATAGGTAGDSQTPLVAEASDFQTALFNEELTAHFAAMNKIREQLLMGMTRDIEQGGDGSRFITALEALNKQNMQSMQTIQFLK